MRYLIFLFCLALFFSACQTETPAKPEEGHQVAPTQTTYDSLLAAQYGADDYGMKSYVMAFLKRGPNRDLSEEEAQKLQMQHLENINRMAEEGDLILAGPFLDDGDIRGIYIFDVRTVEEAEALTNTDPAIKAGSLVMELKPWYGSAALMSVNELHSKLQKKGITEG
jgi:uncharacterized protein YciI